MVPHRWRKRRPGSDGQQRHSVASDEGELGVALPDLCARRAGRGGGAPLGLRRHAGLTLAGCGIRAGSSLQLLERLRGGGGVVVLGGRAFPVSDGGVLDLRSRGLIGPREAAELARWVATPAGAAHGASPSAPASARMDEELARIVRRRATRAALPRDRHVLLASPECWLSDTASASAQDSEIEHLQSALDSAARSAEAAVNGAPATS